MKNFKKHWEENWGVQYATFEYSFFFLAEIPALIALLWASANLPLAYIDRTPALFACILINAHKDCWMAINFLAGLGTGALLCAFAWLFGNILRASKAALDATRETNLTKRRDTLVRDLENKVGAPCYRRACLAERGPRRFVRLLETGQLPLEAAEQVNELLALERTPFAGS